MSWCLSVCLWLWIGGCGLVAVVVSDGEPVSLSDVLPVACGCQFPRCCVSVWDGEPVGLVAVVSTLDTLPAVSLCRGLCRSDGEPVACGGQFPLWCWVSVSDGLPQFQR